MPIFENNRDLLDRFRRGEREALTEVYLHYVDEVAALARRGFTMEAQGHVYVAGARDAGAEADLVQDTFVRAFSERARHAYDGLRPYRAYLLRITKNLMIDRFRSSRRGREVSAQDVGRGVGDIDALLDAGAAIPVDRDPESDLHWQELSAVAAAYVAGLDAETRELVRLRFEEERSQEAVADRLGCSRRRVRTLEARVHRGLEKLLKRRKLLDD